VITVDIVLSTQERSQRQRGRGQSGHAAYLTVFETQW